MDVPSDDLPFTGAFPRVLSPSPLTPTVAEPLSMPGNAVPRVPMFPSTPNPYAPLADMIDDTPDLDPIQPINPYYEVKPATYIYTKPELVNKSPDTVKAICRLLGISFRPRAARHTLVDFIICHQRLQPSQPLDVDDAITAALQDDDIARQRSRRGILRSASSPRPLRPRQVLFPSSPVMSTHILPVETPDEEHAHSVSHGSASSDPDEIYDTHSNPILRKLDDVYDPRGSPLLRKLQYIDAPPPTEPTPFIPTEETDTNPVLRRHLPASHYHMGYTASTNCKLGSSIPLPPPVDQPITQFTVRAKTADKPNYLRELRGPNRNEVLHAAHNEFVRLHDTTKTMKFVNNKPKDAKPTYYNPVLEYKYDQDGKLITRVRGTGGGDQLVYEFGNTSHVADTMAFKLLLNAAVSEDAQLISSDLKDFFLTAALPEKVYLKILWHQLPPETITHYNLTPNIDSKGNQYIYAELSQALYGLPQANFLAGQELKRNLALHGFYETDIPCLFRHATRNITVLVHVDDFITKLSRHASTVIDDALFFQRILTESGYQTKFNWGNIDFTANALPSQYTLTWCGYTIQHDRTQRVITISMDDYYAKIASKLPDNIPLSHIPGLPFNIKYGAKEQFELILPESVILEPAQRSFLQKFIGEILWYSNAVAHDILTAVSKLSSQQSHPTSDTLPLTVTKIQSYLKQYGNHKIQFHASDMILHLMSDASFDSEAGSRSRGGLFAWCGNKQPNLINGPIACQSKILPGVPQSAAAAEISQHTETGKTGILLITLKK